MTVKELEQQLQIPRANIRYYEREGLLRPQRVENNYRDYTDEDVATLEKILLLRQLDMPVETIRAVQTGELPLRDALSHQSTLLSGEAARLEHSRAVCRAMLTDGADYATLDTGRYRCAALSAPAAPPPTPERHPPVDGAVWALSPWQRWLARSFDFSIVDVICALFFSLVFRISEQNAPELVMSLLTAILSWLLIALLEPFLLSTWGTTPGKWLMGLELRDETGKKLSFRSALWRLIGVFSHGYGCSIPIYSLVRNYRCYQDCKAGREMPYDEDEGHLYYSLPGDRWFWRAAVSLAATVLLLAPVELFAEYQVILPPHRGDITPDQFLENVDYIGETRYLQLWRSRDDWAVTGTSPLPGGGTAYHYTDTYQDLPVCTLETDSHGYVTAVVVTAEETGVSSASLPFGPLNNFSLALQGTELTGIGVIRSNITAVLDPDRFSDRLWRNRNGGDLTYYEGPFTLTARLECSDFSSLLFGTLYAADTPGGSYAFTARLEKSS